MMQTTHSQTGRPRKEPLPKSLPNRLRERRNAKGWSLAELARRSGINAQTIHRYETGERDMPGRKRIQLAQALGVLPHELDTGSSIHHLIPTTLITSQHVGTTPQPESATMPDDDREAQIQAKALELAVLISDAAAGLSPARASGADR
jgi:transcriptional regulator with XRE-family HTH domain